jgi:hypothetical protein
MAALQVTKCGIVTCYRRLELLFQIGRCAPTRVIFSSLTAPGASVAPVAAPLQRSVTWLQSVGIFL